MKKITFNVFVLCLFLAAQGCKKVTNLVTPPLAIPTENVQGIADFDIMSILPTANNLDAPLIPSDSKTMAEITAMPLPELGWFYNRVGKSTWFYESKINENTFSEKELKQLIKIVYSALPIERDLDQEAATYALQYSLYRGLNKQDKAKQFSTLLPIAFSPIFLKEAVKNSPSLITYVPRSVSYFDSLCALSIASNPVAFDYLLLEDKIKDPVVSKLFTAQPTLELSGTMLKKKALDYASTEAAMFLMQQDGAALELAPEHLKQNKFIVLSAIKNYSEALAFADTAIQTVVMEKGLVGLVDYQEPTASVVEVKTETLKDKSTRSVYDFNVLQQVVRDTELYGVIEQSVQRKLTELWIVADAGDLGKLYVASFRPIGRNFLGAILLKKPNGDLVRYEIPAVQNPKTPLSVWFKNDNATFLVDNFKILKMSKTAGVARVELTWTQGETVVSLRLQENGKTFKADKTFL